MKNVTKIVFISGCLTWLSSCTFASEDMTSDDGTVLTRAVEATRQWYALLAPKLAPTNVPFADMYRQPFALDDISPAEIKRGADGTLVHIRAPIGFILEQPSNRIVSVSNPHLHKFVETNDTRQVADLTTNSAVEVASGYLKTIGFQCRHPLVLTDAKFNWFLDKHIWCVTWEPVVDGYRFDSFLSYLSQYVCVRFHEQYGFIGFRCSDVLPSPRTTEVKIAREFAVEKAEKVVPLVMRTPFYRMCRDSNFKMKSLKNAELLIAAPNWLLDPKRAIRIYDKPPGETRLCWVVTFETVATRVREDGLNLIPPDILIYLDAATGEIVGANFT